MRLEKMIFTVVMVALLSACGSDSSSSDDSGNSGESTNNAPTVNAGADKSVKVNESITITGTANDSDGSIVAYEWKEGSKFLANMATFDYLPTVAGTDTLTLTVTDDDGATASDSVVVTVTGDVVSTLSNGLVAHYEFEGNANDSSGNGNHGTEYGNINYTIGVVEKSLNLNGSGHINTSLFEKSFLSVGDPIAISVWFKSKQNTTSSHKAIISGNGGGPDFGAYVNSSNFITRTYGGDNGVHNIEVDDDKWHYLVFGVTHDSTTFTYLDGIKLSTSSTIGNYARDEFQIGGTRNGEYRYNGSIDDLRIYNRALNESEIQELYNLKQ